MAQNSVDPTDGLLADVVGPWASEKHERLRKYVIPIEAHERCFCHRAERAAQRTSNYSQVLAGRGLRVPETTLTEVRSSR